VFTHAIVRPPSATFADGLTSSSLGPPLLERALEQHRRYGEALEAFGLTLIRLPADSGHPDSTFVEDVAVLTERVAVLARPGAPSRRGEPATVDAALRPFFPSLHAIRAPGTLDGGDVCRADGTFFIGVSERTNADGARQLAEILGRDGFAATCVDIRGMAGVLHLKTAMASLEGGRLVVAPALAACPALDGFDRIRVRAGEEYGANCLWINGHVLLPAGAPALAEKLDALGYDVTVLDMSEFRKMDGGLSCLSLRFHHGGSHP